MAPKRLLKRDEKGVSGVLMKVVNGLLSRGSGVRISPGAPLPLNPIESKGVTEIILHPLLHPGHLLFGQMGRHGGAKLFFSLLLLIQLFA